MADGPSDPARSEAVIGHRFRTSFDNYDVPVEHTVVNQLRMARKNFTHGVWSEWLDRCRMRHPGRLPDHPEGLWARVWELFEEQRASVEQERAYLHARRVRDEFWYAERFGLTWPRLHSGRIAPSAAPLMSLAASPSPSPSPPPPKRRLVLLFGYWPPTDIGIATRHGMLWTWREVQTYKGYDVLAISPTFPKDAIGTAPVGSTIPFWGKGTGQLIVDYRKTSEDFWKIVKDRLPIAIMSFSRGRDNKDWLIEMARNLVQADWLPFIDYKDLNGKEQKMTWFPPFAGGSAMDFSPYRGSKKFPPKPGNPPDPTKDPTTEKKDRPGHENATCQQFTG